MKLNEEQLTEIERLSGLFFAVKEIATILKVDVDDLEYELEDDESEVAMAYSRGRLLSEAELRKSVILLAKQGSGPAQSMALKLIERQK